MEKDNPDTPQQALQTRKNFLGVGLSAAALFTAFRIFVPEKKKPKTETVKMLGQDGKLVEVELQTFHTGRGKKISDEQLKTWVHKKEG